MFVLRPSTIFHFQSVEGNFPVMVSFFLVFTVSSRERNFVRFGVVNLDAIRNYRHLIFRLREDRLCHP